MLLVLDIYAKSISRTKSAKKKKKKACIMEYFSIVFSSLMLHDERKTFGPGKSVGD